MAKKYGMVIDLGKCVACGSCAIACKTENNTRHEDIANGRKYNWADFHTTMQGTFPDVRYTAVPVMCNHCDNAPCVAACPVPADANGHKAMFKTDTGITMHDDARCIGCQQCVIACPYSSQNVVTEGVQYSVISYNPTGTNSQPFWDDQVALLPGITSNPSEIAGLAVNVPPNRNEYTHPYYLDIRPPNVTEKCYFCDHRLMNGDKPYCTDSCPTGARIFGDQNDPSSEISQILKANHYKRLKNNKGEFLADGEVGTGPNVFYINDYHYTFPVGIEEVVADKRAIKVYPNPATEFAIVEFELDKDADLTVSLFDLQGREVIRNVEKGLISGTQSLKIEVADLTPGTYICTVSTSKGQRLSTKLVINK